jgi:acyl transferase domain-containing protein
MMGPPEPIAVLGMAYKFPQGASSDDSFWNMLMEKRCASKEFPKERMNIDAFYSSDRKRMNCITTRKAHFLDEDIRDFDAQFFGVPLPEAASMDPQHRILLETTYHALENGEIHD